MGNTYVMSERNKYRTRLEQTPNGGTYVFISQKGLCETLTGTNHESSKRIEKSNDSILELEYLKRLMVSLGPKDSSTQANNVQNRPIL